MPFPSSDHPLDDDDRTPIEVLARIPLARELCVSADRGRPLVLEQGEGKVKRIFLELAKKLATELGAVHTSNSAEALARRLIQPQIGWPTGAQDPI